MVAHPNPPPLPPEATDAPPPPPGYRYDIRGRLLPLLQTRLPLTDPQAQEIFLEILELTGNARAALDALGIVTPEAINTHIQRDPAFAERIQIAVERHRQKIYAAAFQRAVHGYEVPIVGGQFKDEIVAYERRYSDSLMALLLKRHFPEFREAGASSTTKVTVNNQPVLKVDVSALPKKKRDALRLFLEKTDGEELENQLAEEKAEDKERAKRLEALEEGAIDIRADEKGP